MRQAFRQEEAEQILLEASRRAAEQATVALSNPEISEERLREMAEELGISEETLAAVLLDREREAQTQSPIQVQEAPLREQYATAAERKAFIEHRRAEFMQDVWSYLGVNGLLVGIWLLSQPHGAFWPQWTLFFWGIALLFHSVSACTTKGDEFERDLEKWTAKRRKRTARLVRKEQRQSK